MTDTCIIVQGPTLENVKTYYNNNVSSICDVLFSTWEGEEYKYTYENVIFNKVPLNCGVGNLYNQQASTLNGLLKAKCSGFKKVIKIRSSMIITNPCEFIDLFVKKLNFFLWHNHLHGYITDYLMGGDIDYMINLWSNIDKTKEWEYAEQAITNSFFKNVFHLLEKQDFYFFGNLINQENDVICFKNKLNLSDKSKYPLSDTISSGCYSTKININNI